MSISTLISELQKMQAQHGDVVVRVRFDVCEDIGRRNFSKTYLEYADVVYMEGGELVIDTREFDNAS